MLMCLSGWKTCLSGRKTCFSGTHVSLGGRHKSLYGGLKCLFGRHIFLSGRHIFLSERHTFLSGRHIFLSERHTFLSGRHIFLYGRHTFLSDIKYMCLLHTTKFWVQRLPLQLWGVGWGGGDGGWRMECLEINIKNCTIDHGFCAYNALLFFVCLFLLLVSLTHEMQTIRNEQHNLAKIKILYFIRFKTWPHFL